MVIYTNVKSVMTIIDTTITNVNILRDGVGVINIKFETVKNYRGLDLNNRSVGYEPAG
jgi:hypothetical protein